MATGPAHNDKIVRKSLDDSQCTILTKNQRDEFHANGMLVLPKLIGPDALQNARDETLRIEKLTGELRVMKRPSGMFVSRIHLRLDFFGRLCHSELFCPLLRSLLGEGDCYVTFAQTIRKPPGATSLGWHQDAYYSAYDPDGSVGVESPQKDFLNGSVTVWLALTRAHRQNGGLEVAPKLHKFGLLDHKYDNHGKEWVLKRPPVRAIGLDLEPGDALVFTRLTPHRSFENCSSEDRLGLKINYSLVPGGYGGAVYKGCSPQGPTGKGTTALGFETVRDA